jgi:predicted HTH domain antitoxin
MTQIVLEVPRDVLEAMKLPPAEVEREMRRELAVALYERGVLGIGKARELAGMTRWEFEDLLGARQVVRQYLADNLREDIEYATGR